MFKYSNINDLSHKLNGTAIGIAFGNFDGHHVGHAKLIEKLKDECRKRQLDSVVLTLTPHPKLALENEKNFLLTTPKLKEKFLLESGVKYLLELEFSCSLAKISGEDFIKNLFDELNIKLIQLGHDFALGNNRSYGVDNLKKDFNNRAEIIESKSYMIDNEIISSSLIRNLIKDGNIRKANQYLGHNYILSGEVYHGKQLGRKIGFPTINLNLNDYQVIPNTGVYIGGVTLDKFYPAAVNIGHNPTTDDHDQKKLEMHLIGFNQDISEQNLDVVLFEKIREEKKFSSIDALKLQIGKDVEKTRKYFL